MNLKGAGLKIPGKYDSQIRDLRYSLYLLRRSALAMLGISLVASIVILATFAPYIAPYGAETANLGG